MQLCLYSTNRKRYVKRGEGKKRDPFWGQGENIYKIALTTDEKECIINIDTHFKISEVFMNFFKQLIIWLLVLSTLLCLVVSCTSKGGNDQVTDKATTPAMTTPNITTDLVSTKPKETLQPPSTFGTTTAGADAITTSYRENVSFNVTENVPVDGMISNAAQLQAVLTNGSATANYTVVASELDCAGLGWTGLKNYKGTFDFGGCVVKNASCSMFVSLAGGTVKNLVIADSNYVYSDWDSKNDEPVMSSHSARIYYGTVVCYMTRGVVDNITVESSVSMRVSIMTDKNGIGGIVGWAQGSGMTISNCSFKGEFVTDSLMGYHGGIVGNFYGGSYSFNENSLETADSKVVGCSFYGTMKTNEYSLDSKLGGISGGLNNGAIIRCANYGRIMGGNNAQTAGIVAYVYLSVGVINCLNVGQISTNKRAAGICAYTNGSDRYFYGCLNMGKISSSTSTQTAGIIALANSKEHIIKCFNYSRNTAVPLRGVNDKAISLTTSVTGSGELTIRDCTSLGSFDSLATAVNTAIPGVFAFDSATQSVTLISAK